MKLLPIAWDKKTLTVDQMFTLISQQCQAKFWKLVLTFVHLRTSVSKWWISTSKLSYLQQVTKATRMSFLIILIQKRSSYNTGSTGITALRPLTMCTSKICAFSKTETSKTWLLLIMPCIHLVHSSQMESPLHLSKTIVKTENFNTWWTISQSSKNTKTWEN